jgi:F-type H+-transporting ATPase subunit b
MGNEMETLPVDDAAQALPLGHGLIDSTQNAIIGAAENVSQVFDSAGKTVANELEVVPFYGEVHFWIGVAFILAILVLLMPAYRYIKGALQNRVDKVIGDIDEAIKLRDDAQVLLAEYERKFVNMQAEAQTIVTEGLNSLKNMQKNEAEQLKNELENKQKEAERRIKTATQKAQTEINQVAGRLSVDWAQKAIEHYLQTADKSQLIDNAINDLDKFIKAS